MTWDSRKEDHERRRFVDDGLKHRPPVFATAVFFLAMWLSGWACSTLLLALGMHSIPARYAISTLVSYGVFIGSVGLWCRHAASSQKSRKRSGSFFDGFDLPLDVDDGCLPMLAIIAVLFLLSGIFWLVGGYALLFEVAFEAAFAGTIIYRLNRPHILGNWWETLIRRTWLPALIIAGLLVAAGAKLQHDHPEASTMAQALKARQAAQKQPWHEGFRPDAHATACPFRALPKAGAISIQSSPHPMQEIGAPTGSRTGDGYLTALGYVQIGTGGLTVTMSLMLFAQALAGHSELLNPITAYHAAAAGLERVLATYVSLQLSVGWIAGTLQLAAGLCCLRGSHPGLVLVASLVSLANFPHGTLAAILMLVALRRPEIARLFAPRAGQGS